MHKRSTLVTHNYFKNEAKKIQSIYPLFLLAISSLGVSYFVLKDLDWEEHVSIERGLFLFSSGLIFFPSLYVIINKLMIHTHEGRKFARAHNMHYYHIYDVSNKAVSAVQALFCCLTGLTSTCYSCSRDMLHTSHYISEAYAWFGAAYFFYDIWSMYKVWSAKVVQPDLAGIKDKILLKVFRLMAYLKDNFMIVGHHIFIGCFGFLVITYLRGGLGDCFFGYVYLMEASTPFVSIRGILSTLGMKETKIYVANGLLMLLSFFVFRVAMWPYVIALYGKSIQADLLTALTKLPRNCLISIGILLFPQLWWFVVMCKGAAKILFKKPTKGAGKPVSNNSNNNHVKKKTR